MKVVFIVPYPQSTAPSQRFRFEQFYDVLQESGIDYTVYSFYSLSAYKRIYGTSFLYKSSYIVLGYFRRIIHLLKVISADRVFIHREATPFGPPIFEFLITRIFRKKTIYDFDDAIWLKDDGDTLSKLKSYKKFRRIISWSTLISAGNSFLADYARKFNSEVRIVPTVVDTDYHKPVEKETKKDGVITLGWTGSHTTAKYIEPLFPELDKLHKEKDFKFLFISNKPPESSYPWLHYKEWNSTSEIQDLNLIDIGLMPLPDDDWAKGKCGFKLIQYMALQIPSIGSDVGVNSNIVTPPENGLLAKDYSDIQVKIKLLMEDPILRDTIKRNCRSTVIEYYSKTSNAGLFLSLF